MYSIDYTTRFKKDLKRCRKRGLDIQMIQDAIALLRTTGSLPAKYRPLSLPLTNNLTPTKTTNNSCPVTSTYPTLPTPPGP